MDGFQEPKYVRIFVTRNKLQKYLQEINQTALFDEENMTRTLNKK